MHQAKKDGCQDEILQVLKDPADAGSLYEMP
ncbi:hypothetical protein K151_1117 [Proteus hauseri ZMd44]|nr:hypothetical protein K151_1117 [Proteus hauseri ZMd44]